MGADVRSSFPRIQIEPPFRLVFQPAVEPSQGGFVEENPLVVRDNRMVFVGERDELGFPAQKLEGGEKLDAFPRRNVRVGRAVEEKQRRRDLVGVEQRAPVDIDVFSIPGEAAGRGHGAVRVSPVSLSPIAGDRADSGVGYRGREHRSLGRQGHRHESAVFR